MTTLGFSGNSLTFQDVEIIQDETFWPALNVAELQAQRKIPVAVDGATLAGAILSAVATVNLALASFVDQKKTVGYATASAVPGARVSGDNQLTAQYKKAVYALAKADLLGEFASVARLGKTGQTGGGTTADDEEAATRNMLIAEYAMVIRNILGMGRATVALL
ncbi:head completion/stabilization protein [Acerihabitans arboris]|uniref:Head completion protein n=1 Tax=Acerihabitans arboris TaxID=2691583 RepID=A0A845SNQ6_9GAMM|nr:head completion/stabilization protein [Acerihabitans arboris]NDL64827.1 head completion protein [Acerihabitans arboris]